VASTNAAVEKRRVDLIMGMVVLEDSGLRQTTAEPPHGNSKRDLVAASCVTKNHDSNRFARGSASTVPQEPGLVTNGPPSSGATPVKATSGISLGLPARGKSLRSG
jgi:hypothetical protein